MRWLSLQKTLLNTSTTAVLPKKIELLLLPMCPAPHEPDVSAKAKLKYLMSTFAYLVVLPFHFFINKYHHKMSA